MSTPAGPVAGEINLIDPDGFLHGFPHETWRRLRAQQPVYWQDPWRYYPGFWAITRAEDIIRISRDPRTFISGRGITAGDNSAQPDPAAGHGVMMITTDPPRHVRLRRLVNKGFTPRMVGRLEPHVRAIVDGIIDRVAPLGACDFVTDVAAQLPLAVICDMMGVPQADWQRMFELTNQTLGADDPEYQTAEGNAEETSFRARMEMFQYFAGLVGQRRHERQEDLLSVLAGAEVDGERLTDEEILWFCFLLIVAGNETTRNATSGGMLALVEHPVQRAKLQADPSLLPGAIEEILRWTSPVMHMARVATRDVELGGQLIKANQKLVLWYPSANRDEAVFKDPDVFDIQRSPNDHLAFGIGEHFCLGAGLARLELRVMFEQLLRRLPDLELAGPVERLRSNFIGGIKHIPVRYTPAG
jgi:cytochrome P450